MPRLAAVILANCAILVLLVAGLEWASSLLVKKPGDYILKNYRLNHSYRPHDDVEHREWIAHNPDFPRSYVTRVNGQGWPEDEDVEKRKPTGTYRIFYVGDSFTQGVVPMDSAVPERVEAALNATPEYSGVSFQVVNTGTTSYSPVIYYVLIRYVIMDYAPDLVFVNVDMTDCFDDWKYLETLCRDAEGNPWAVPPRDLYRSLYIDTEGGPKAATAFTRVQLFLAEHSYAYNLLRYHIPWRNHAPLQDDAVRDSLYRGMELPGRWEWCRHEWDDSTRAHVDFTLDMLRRTMRLCRERGVRLAVTSVPHYRQYTVDSSGVPVWSTRPHEVIRAECGKAGVPYLDSYAALKSFIAGTVQTAYYYKDDMHFNPRGYHIWSDAHIAFLCDTANHLLPAPVAEGTRR